MGEFKEIRSEDVPLLQATFHEFEHVPTGAKHIHFACEDDNLSFATIIAAVPSDETGAPHILEHCVITGGSKRYPDARSRGALRVTRGGAWTGWEYTWYFFESRFKEDFLKRIDIDLDFIFEPLLEEETFWKEGHHLEFEDPEDPATPLRIRGVIFNEQKGIFALPLYVSWTELGRALFPGMPYALEHGGTAPTIPNLTWEGLRAFHDKHYHPANAYLLSWGDITHKELHEVMDLALSRVPERPFERTLVPPLEKPTTARRHIGRLPIPAGQDPTARGMVLMGWVTALATDPYEFLLYDLIVDLLMGSPSAPLRKALAESGLGKNVAETFDRYGLRYRDLVFSVGLQDVDPTDADRVEGVIMDTLSRIERQGFKSDEIDAALHRLEFGRRVLQSVQGGEGLPTSLWIEHINTPWIHGGDPLKGAKIERELARIEDDRKSGRPIEERIKQWLLDNPHRALVFLEADPGADVRMEEAERAQLAALKEKLSDQERQQIVENTRRLRTHQEQRTAPPPIPKLDSAATAPKSPVLTPTRFAAGGVDAEAFAVRTGEITYIDFFADLGALPDELWDHLRLFSLALTRAGADGRSPDEMASYISSTTGGLSAEVLVPVDASGDHHRRLLRFGGRALERRQDELVSILTALLARAEFTTDVLQGVVARALSQAEQGVFVEATAYLKALAGSHVRESWRRRERLFGFSHLKLLRDLASGKQDLGMVANQLTVIREHIAQRGRLKVFVAASGEGAIDQLQSSLNKALSSIPAGGELHAPFADRLSDDVSHEARTAGMPSAFNCEVIPIPGPGHADHAVISTASGLLSRFVRNEVARKGTAYGATTDAYSDAGTLAHLSIRDPNIARTYRAFAEAARHLREDPIDDNDFDAARFEASVAADLPQTPPNKARRTFLESQLGFDRERLPKHLDALARVTKEDVRRVAQEHLAVGGARATLASSEMLELARKDGVEFQSISEA